MTTLLTSINKDTPLAALRAQGVDVDFDRCRLAVFPKQKITPAILSFVNSNLIEIVDEMNLEAHYSKKRDPLGYLADAFRFSTTRVGQGYFLFQLPDEVRAELGAKPIGAKDAILAEFNGALLI
ncbi:MAG: hypothetical protein Q7U38_10750 [Methylobacter sp.]|nr:hypothetical protein [Methylobacter sp.]MDP2098065.1 hypothetical protein [Methylobacter sp.]MDP2430241.1 hypothetical protein [Methylobacter sp.]MDP3055879.1 hypothetical protein [Methylobacter sp.]MDP3361593.1 hypothetical protein [Methylobacter sp.]